MPQRTWKQDKIPILNGNNNYQSVEVILIFNKIKKKYEYENVFKFKVLTYFWISYSASTL